MSEPVLQVKGLKTYYYTEEGVVPAVDGLDFEVEPGETFAIVGTRRSTMRTSPPSLLSRCRPCAISCLRIMPAGLTMSICRNSCSR